MIKKTAVLLSAVCALCPLGAAAVDINESIKIDYENYSVTLTAENGSAAQPIGLYLTDEDGNCRENAFAADFPARRKNCAKHSVYHEKS